MDIVLCFNEFRYLLTIRTHIDELFSHLNTDSLLYQIYGGYNLMKILNMNDIINIGEQCKSTKLCYIYNILYTHDVDIICHTLNDLILFINNLIKIFYKHKLINTFQSLEDFNKYINNINLTSTIIEYDNIYIILGNYLKTLISIKNKLHNNFDTLNFKYILNESLDFLLQIFNDTLTYNYKLFNVHIGNTLELQYYDKFKNSKSFIERFFLELEMYYTYINSNGFYNVEKDIRTVLFIDTNLENLTTLDFENLTQIISNLDTNIKFKIQRILLCLNLFIFGFINYIIINDEYINYISNSDNQKKMQEYYGFYTRLAILLNIKLTYIDEYMILFEYNSSLDKELFINNIKSLYSDINTKMQKIIKKYEEIKQTHIYNKNSPNTFYDKDIIKSTLQQEIISNYGNYGNLNDFDIGDILESDTLSIKLSKYHNKLKELDNDEIIYKYTGTDIYKDINTYITKKIYNNISQDINFENNIDNILTISKELSKMNDFIFNNDYIYTFRNENYFDFGNTNTYMTSPINTEFMYPYSISTSIDAPVKWEVEKNIVIRIKLTQNNIFCVILKYSRFPHEKEILIPYGTIYKLKSRECILVNNKTIYLIDLEIVNNIYDDNITNLNEMIEYYVNKYIINRLYLQITQDNALICNIENVDAYITKLYNAFYSKTVPMVFQNDNIYKIIKGYLYRKKIINYSYYDYNDYDHPLNIELKLLELTSKMLNLDNPPTPHLINSYGKVKNCNLSKFMKYIKNICIYYKEQSWICNTQITELEYFDKMKFVSIEYADHTLKSLSDHTDIDEKRLCSIYFQIFYTLKVMYDYFRFIHFDLKPDNILFVKDPNYKVDSNQYYEYTINDEIYYIPIYEFIVKLADYDASFYNGINNVFITKDTYHNKIINFVNEFGQLDIYQIFNLLDIEKIKSQLLIILDISNFDLFKNINIYNFFSGENKLLTKFKELFKINPLQNIIKNYFHNTDKIYKNLIIEPQKHDIIVDYNRLKISNEYRINSIQKLKILRNNSHTLRIMTYNIHEWKDANNNNTMEYILNDILIVSPDILCLQENKKDIIFYNYKKFTDNYTLINECDSDNNLVNSIFIKYTIQSQIENIQSFNIGDKTKDNDAKKRCCTCILYTFKNDKKLLIANTHLHYNTFNGDTLKNMENLINQLPYSYTNKIILGDFNSYCKTDYKDMNSFLESKKSMGNLDELNKQSLFDVCDLLIKNNYKDMYKSYLNTNYESPYIPINTNRYGGRIDHMFWNITDNIEILGIYTLYSNYSDHIPIIVDLYDPPKHFDYNITIKDYLKFENKETIILNKIKNNVHNLFNEDYETFRNNPEFMLKAITINVDAYNYASDSLRINKQFIFRAIDIDKNMFYFIDKTLKTEYETLKTEYDKRNYISNKSVIIDDIEKALKMMKHHTLYLKNCSPKLQNNKTIVLATIKYNDYQLEFASNELKSDEIIVLTALNNNGRLLQYANINLQGNKDIVFNAVNNNADSINFASVELKSDPDIILETIKDRDYSSLLEKASDELKKNKDYILKAVEQNGKSILFADIKFKDDKDVILKACIRYYDALSYSSISDNLNKDLVLRLIKKDPKLIYKIASNELDKNYVLKVVEQNGLVLSHLDSPYKYDKNIIFKAVTHIGTAILDGSNILNINKNIILKALEQGKYMVYINLNINLQKDKDIILKTVNHLDSIYNAGDELKKNKDYILKIVEKNGDSLEDVINLKNDRDVVLKAVEQYGKAIIYADRKLQKDIDIILKAFKYHDAFKKVPTIYKKNIDYVLQLFEQNDFDKVHPTELNSVHKIVRNIISFNKIYDTPILLKIIKNNVHILRYFGRETYKRYFILEAVKQNGLALAYASYKLQKDKDVVLEAVKQNGLALAYASYKLQKDKDVVLEAVKQNGLALLHASYDLRKDRTIVLAAVQENSSALKFTSFELQKDKQLILQLIGKDEDVLQYASYELKNDKEFVLQIVSQNGLALKYVSFDLQKEENIILDAIAQNGLSLQYAVYSLQNKEDIVLKAIAQNGLSLQYASFDLQHNKDVVLAAIAQNGLALQYASFDLQNDKDIISKAIEQNCLALQFANYDSQNDGKIVLKIINTNGLALAYASYDLKKNKYVVLAAVKQNGLALQHTIFDLQDDKDAVLKAVKQNGLALQYASFDQQSNIDVVVDAVTQNGLALQYTVYSLQNNKDVVSIAIKQNGLSLQYASSILQNDESIVLDAVKQNELALQFASMNLLENKTFVLYKIKNKDNYINALFYKRNHNFYHMKKINRIFDKLNDNELLIKYIKLLLENKIFLKLTYKLLLKIDIDENIFKLLDDIFINTFMLYLLSIYTDDINNKNILDYIKKFMILLHKHKKLNTILDNIIPNLSDISKFSELDKHIDNEEIKLILHDTILKLNSPTTTHI
jgi:endonuclease/exonuclease/phosphatase family metal-dependent hydrolase